MPNFEERLTGGHPNSLGNTLAVVEEVFADASKFDELFNCWFSGDEIVRLRTANAVKRCCLHSRQLVAPYVDTLLTRVSAIDQASTQWTLAELFRLLYAEMNAEQRVQALRLLKRNLAEHDDWIVLNNTMKTLSQWAKDDRELSDWLLPHLQRLTGDSRKSVARRATKLLSELRSS